MNEKQLFNAINHADSQFIEEALTGIGTKNAKRIKFKNIFVKLIAAALAVITITGTGMTVFAAINPTFKEWLYQYFDNSQVTQITNISNSTSQFVLDKNMRITGTNESFIEKYQLDHDDNEIVSEVYQIKNKKIKLLKKKTFEGNYNNIRFSFDYCTINNEIDAFNYSKNINEVFHYKNNNIVYLALDNESLNSQYILQIDLKSEKIICIHTHKHMCNMKMSPNGKTILLNYRALEYWSVLDLGTQKETKIDCINPYTHTEEILFLNDYLIETYGEFKEDSNTEIQKTIAIDLKRFETKTVCEGTGDICVNWQFNYDIDKDALEIKNLYDNSSFYVDNVSTENGQYSISTVTCDKNFALFYNEISNEYYLCNLVNETNMKFSIPYELCNETEIFIAGQENKLIISNDQTAYLIDIKDL